MKQKLLKELYVLQYEGPAVFVRDEVDIYWPEDSRRLRDIAWGSGGREVMPVVFSERRKLVLVVPSINLFPPATAINIIPPASLTAPIPAIIPVDAPTPAVPDTVIPPVDAPTPAATPDLVIPPAADPVIPPVARSAFQYLHLPGVYTIGTKAKKKQDVFLKGVQAIFTYKLQMK